MLTPAPYHQPATLDEALDILARGGLTVAAGCTDLFAATERRDLPGAVLDVSRVAGLRGIGRGDDALRIGAMTTWAEIRDADLPPAFDGLKLAAREVGARQIQARGTLGGNLCNASPAADGVPPLLTLDAEVELARRDGVRRMALADYLIGPRQTARAPDELLTAVVIPAEACTGTGHFLKLGARKHLVISIAMTAARLVVEDGIVRHAALSVGACSPVATRLPEAEAALVGHPLDPARLTVDVIAPRLSPIADARADAAYRTTAAVELLRRTIAPGRRVAA